MANLPGAELNRELIQQLCVEAGCIMENASVTMVSAMPASPAEIRSRVQQLLRAAASISALANAAGALVR